MRTSEIFSQRKETLNFISVTRSYSNSFFHYYNKTNHELWRNYPKLRVNKLEFVDLFRSIVEIFCDGRTNKRTDTC